MSYAFTAGSGTTVYCDVYGTPTSPSAGDNLPVVKLMFGALGAGATVTSANPLPVQHGNGTQTMPTGDAVGRRIYVQQCDGTNSMPSMDAAGRPGYVKVTDGTNTQPTGDAAARAIYTAPPGTTNPSANFTRPADTTAYTSGDLVANNVTAGSVTPLSWTAARVAAGSFSVRRARLKKSGTTVTSASFRLHLYGASPAVTNGDNGAWLSTQSTYLGSFDLDMSGSAGRVFSDGAEVVGGPTVGTELNVTLASGQTVYGLLEARGAYTPASAETFTAELEVVQN